MKKLLGIVVLGLLWCNISFASELLIRGFITGIEKGKDNEIIQKYIEGNLLGIYSGFMMSIARNDIKSFCVPEKLYINVENLIDFVEQQIEIDKERGLYDESHPIAFVLMNSLERTFPCN